MADVESLFKGTTRNTRREKVCLRGDLADRMTQLKAAHAAAAARDADSFAGGEAGEVEEQIEALRVEMEQSVVEFQFVTLEPLRPMRLVMEHQPRPDNAIDKLLGYNQDTYYKALVQESCASVTGHDGSVVAADAISDEAWSTMLAALGAADFDALVNAALDANGRVSVPFSQPASRTSPSTAGASKPPKPGTSPRSGSKAGSRKSSPSSSTTTPGA